MRSACADVHRKMKVCLPGLAAHPKAAKSGNPSILPNMTRTMAIPFDRTPKDVDAHSGSKPGAENNFWPRRRSPTRRGCSPGHKLST